MPKAPGGSPSVTRMRHNPLAEDYSPTSPYRSKAPKRRKTASQDKDAPDFVESKASRRILQIGQDLVDEDTAERKASAPNPAFSSSSRFPTGPDDELPAFDAGDDEEHTYPDDVDADWGSDDGDDNIPSDVELDPADQAIFDRFNPSRTAGPDPSLLFKTSLSNDAHTSTSDVPSPGNAEEGSTNLADLILAKIAAHEAAAGAPPSDPDFLDRIPSPTPLEAELPPKVIEVYTQVGSLLARHRSGPLPKPFKILPTLPPHQIPLLIDLTKPENWTPHAYFLATRLFISAKPAVAQPFLHELLLPKVRDEIAETKKLHAHLFAALKKALYKPACFFKGFLFPLLEENTCTLREAHIVSSVVARISVPVLHSAAALLRLCDIAAEQFSLRKDDGGGGATNTFIRVLLEKKYALPYKVVDALVFHFLRFKGLADVARQQQQQQQQNGGGDGDVAMAMGGNGGGFGGGGAATAATTRRDAVAGRLPVLWHRGLLAFAQRYRNEITEEQREALLDLVNAVGHRQMGPETRRELLEGRGRGVAATGASAAGARDEEMADGGDDTMMTA